MSLAKQFALLALAVGSGLFLAGCEPKASTAPAQATLASIAVTPNPASVAKGATIALAVSGTYSDGSHYDLTSGSTFVSSDKTVASVSAAGIVTAVASGAATITATHTASGKTATTTVNVPPPALVSIALSPVTVLLAINSAQPLKVIGTYSDGSTADLTAGATFASSDATVARISTSGVVTGVSAGTALVTAVDTASGKNTAAAVTVKPSYAVLDFNTAGVRYTLSPFGGAAATLTSTGVPAGGPGNQVVQLVKTKGAQCYAGVTLSVGGSGSIGAVPFSSTATLMQVQLYVPAASVGVDIKLKVENATNGSISVETDVIATTAGWQTLTFDFAKPAAGTPALNLNQTYNKISLFADFTCANGNPPPAADETFYVGPIVFLGALAPAAPPLAFTYTVLDFNTAGLTYTLTPFGNQIATLTATGVPPGGPTNQVARLDKPPSGLCYAGTTLSVGYLLSIGQVPFSTTATTMTVQIYVPIAGVVVKLKVEDAGGSGAAVETDVTPATTGWQTLTFDFSKQSTGTPALDPAKTYNKLSIFGDFTCVNGNPAPASDEVFYVGPIVFVGASGPSAPPLSPPPPPSTPTTLPPTPAVPVANVISLYSSVTGGYNGSAADRSANVDTWLTCWSAGTGGVPAPTITVGANSASPRKYVMTAAANFVGVEVLGKTGATQPGSCGGTINLTHEIDVSAMNFLHVDVWTPDDSTNFQVKLVDAGANGLLNGQDTNGIATLTAGSTPPLATGTWLSYDLAIGADFPGNNFPGNNASTLHHFGQLVFVAPNGGTIYIDNLYFHK
jgi:hypothetical protein